MAMLETFEAAIFQINRSEALWKKATNMNTAGNKEEAIKLTAEANEAQLFAEAILGRLVSTVH